MSLPDLSGIPLGPIRPPTFQPPLLSGLPKAQRAFQKKYSNTRLQLALNQLPASARGGLIDYDLSRVNRGQPPLSTNQTLGGIQSILNRKPFTPTEPEGLLGRIAGDIRTLIDVPHMVSGLVSEVRQLPEAPQKLSEVLGRGSAQDILAGLQEVPGVRDIPGVYTVSQVAKEGPGGLLEHPVFTALDVLPFAKKPVAGLAERAVTSGALPRTAERVAQARTIEESLAPTRTAVREAFGLTPLPPVSNLRLAGRVSPNLRRLRTTPIGQQLSRAFGVQTQDMAQLASMVEARLRANVAPDVALSHPAITAMTRPMAEAIRDMRQYTDIPEARRFELTKLIENPRQAGFANVDEALASLPDREAAFLNTARTHSDIMGNIAVGKGWLARIDNEIYDLKTGANLLRARDAFAKQQDVASARSAVDDLLNGPSPTGEVFPTLDTSRLLREGLGNKGIKAIGRAYANQVSLSGFDSSVIRQAVKGNKPSPQAIIDAIEETRANPIPRPLLSPDDTIQKLVSQSRSDPSYAVVVDHLRRGNYIDAANKFRTTIFARKKFDHPDAGLLMDSLDRFAQAAYDSRSAARDFTQLTFKRAARDLERVESKTIPARFVPAYEAAFQAGLRNHFAGAKNVMAALDEGMPYELIPALAEDPKLLKSIKDDALATVQRLRVEGYDPQFIHRIGEHQVSEIFYPHLSDVLRTPSQAKERTFDATPYIPDAALAVSHQASELLTRLSVEEFIGTFIQAFGKDRQQLLNEFLPAARSLAESEPRLDIRGHLEQLLRREYKVYDPKSIFPTKQVWLKTMPTPRTEVWIPKSMEKALQDMFRSPGGFTGALEKPMNLFRMSVLAFSPRFQVNNVGGGLILTGVENPKILWTALTQMKRIREFMRSKEAENIPGMPPGGMGSVPIDMREWLARATPLQRTIAQWNFRAGLTLQRWLGDSVGNAPGAIRRAADKMYRLNGFVDDFYRAAAYLTGFDETLGKNMSFKARQQAGIALVRKTLPEWDRITPFERNIVRSIFPFYTFAKFITSYAMRYPMDHPFRMAVMSNLVKNEYNEFGDWLPQRFASMFFLGHPDAKGNVNALSTSGINPFQDVANYFTLQGYLGKVNPLISALLETAGIDPSKGVQDLYPEVAFDPVTGTLRPRNPNLLSSVIGNLVPQTQIVTSLIGRNKDFANILKANPEAGIAYLRSNIGLPNIQRTVNVPREAIRAEIQRQSLQDTVRNEALRSGDWSRALRFPKLKPFFQTLKDLMDRNPELFKQYQSATKEDSGDAFFQALLTRNVPGLG